MPVPVENWSDPELHLMYLAKSGWPQPNPVPNGYLTWIVPHVLWHVPLMGTAWPPWTTEKRAWRRNKRGMQMSNWVFEGTGIVDSFAGDREWWSEKTKQSNAGRACGERVIQSLKGKMMTEVFFSVEVIDFQHSCFFIPQKESFYHCLVDSS